MIKKWPIIESTEGPDLGLFGVKVNRCRSPRTGKEHDFYVFNFPNWVQVIPITPDNKVVMVRQYRHGCSRIFLEIPGGLIDKDDRNPEETAQRELLEETGYRAEHLVLLSRIYPQPAVFSQAGFTYVAREVRKVAEPTLDAAEDIEVKLVTLESIPEMIRTGDIDQGQTVMALSLYFLMNK